MEEALTLVTGHQDVRVLLEMLRNKVANGVILLLDQEIGTVGHACQVLAKFSLAFATLRPQNVQSRNTHEGMESR